MTWDIDILNIAGIRNGKAQLEPGTNVVQASNFRGKSSFITAIQTVMGATQEWDSEHPLTEGESEGRVELDTGSENYAVELKRQGTSGTVSFSGNPYLTDEQDLICARLFAFLGENNPIREAVREGNKEKLTKHLQKPLEVEQIEWQISNLKDKRENLDEQIDDAEDANRMLPQVQEKITSIKAEIEELEQKKEDLEQESDENSEQKQIGNDLSSAESNLNTIENGIKSAKRTINTTTEKLERKREELEKLQLPEDVDNETDIEQKQDRAKELKLQIDLLQQVHSVNKTVLDDNELHLLTDVDRGIQKTEFDCWLSGDKTDEETVRNHLDQIEEKRKTLAKKRSEISDEIAEVKEQRKQARRKKQKKENLEKDIGEAELTLKEAERELEDLQERKAKVESKIEELNQELQEAGEDLSEDLQEVRTNISIKENELERKQEKIEDLEQKVEQAKGLEEERKEIKEEIGQLRDRKESKNREIQTRFDEAFDDVLERFGPGFDGANLKLNKDTEEFSLSVVRDGRVTDIANLSEGEVELVGFITALAGYKTFNVSDRVPIMLVDGIGQLAAENAKSLIDYLEDASEMMVTTAYPEAGGFDGAVLDPDDWEVVSDKVTA